LRHGYLRSFTRGIKGVLEIGLKCVEISLDFEKGVIRRKEIILLLRT